MDYTDINRHIFRKEIMQNLNFNNNNDKITIIQI